MNNKFKIKLIVVFAIFFFLPKFTFAASLNERVNFFVDSNYDVSGRESISASLKLIGPNAYFYVEDDWYNSLSSKNKMELEQSLSLLSNEFYLTIYPKLTSTYGFEYKPGIDNDNRITILFEQMSQDAGGYFNSGDEYEKIQNPKSNQREMIYVNTDRVLDVNAKSLLAHEFTHLITFNQKDKKQGASEDVWLNEARAEYASTLVGYDNNYNGSNLEDRVQGFIRNPSDSIIGWNGGEADYGTLNLFTQYLVEHYGIAILADSMHSSMAGINSINYALAKNGFLESFSEVFSNWAIASLINDCSLDKDYCYTAQNLKNFKINPTLNFLPFIANTTLNINDSVNGWSGYWYKFIGGIEGLELTFKTAKNDDFTVFYILEDNSGNIKIERLLLDKFKEGEISISNFGSQYKSLVVIPMVLSGDGSDIHQFSLTAYTKETEETIDYLLGVINDLTKQINDLQAKINALLGQSVDCSQISNDLSIGAKSSEVKCLQQFLKDQGVYPEGIISGYFGSLTKSAVIRFQEKYKAEILSPLGLNSGTGFVGWATREKINQLLK